MENAEFEEKEYEAPLYRELGGNNPNTWAPGQVFENLVGFDRALLSANAWIFQQCGHSHILEGVTLTDYQWPPTWFENKPNRLPDFRFNLFIQAKRPQRDISPNPQLRKLGISGPFWQFKIEDTQQQALENVASKIGNDALFAYAAPVFHTHADLWEHTKQGTILESSTCPSIAKLKGHRHWVYTSPGASGIAKSKPETLHEDPLHERIRELIRESRREVSEVSSLQKLSLQIRTSFRNTKTSNPNEARLFDLMNKARFDFKVFDKSEAIVPYLDVVSFCFVYKLKWLVIA